jgi:hypothetical protein
MPRGVPIELAETGGLGIEDSENYHAWTPGYYQIRIIRATDKTLTACRHGCPRGHATLAGLQ